AGGGFPVGFITDYLSVTPTRRASEGRGQEQFFLTYASGFHKCATSKLAHQVCMILSTPG
ncbi:hypothetical protein, partial [Roseovarius sp.]|uniref:hypothetical protein n=1 Tax=Roseovarius sp. TaxID=1486281 RepID=UPI0035672F34